jgi:hypothetical protein
VAALPAVETCRCAACLRSAAARLRTPLRVIAASSSVGGPPRHLRMSTKIQLLTTSHRGQTRRSMLPHTALFRLAFTVRVAIRTPRPSGTGDAQCTSPYRTLLSNCVVQRMRIWALPALLFISGPACRQVGRRPDGCAHRWEAPRPSPLRHRDPSRRISLGSRRSSARCARTAPDSPLRVVSACDTTRSPTN